MSVKPVVAYANEILRKKSTVVTGEINENIIRFCQDLAETMEVATGSGIAAPQIGCSLRIFIINKAVSNTQEHVTFINPVIESKEGTQKNLEGCLSFPGVFLEVNRPEKITVSYTDLNNDRQTVTAEGYYAQAIMHEYDHLEGRLLVDYAPLVKKELMRKKGLKLKGKYYDYRNPGAKGSLDNQPHN